MNHAQTSTLITLAASVVVQAQEFTIDLSGVGSWDALGSSDNIVLTESLPAGSIVNGVTWTDVTGSWFGVGPLGAMKCGWISMVNFQSNSSPDEGSGECGRPSNFGFSCSQLSYQ